MLPWQLTINGCLFVFSSICVCLPLLFNYYYWNMFLGLEDVRAIMIRNIFWELTSCWRTFRFWYCPLASMPFSHLEWCSNSLWNCFWIWSKRHNHPNRWGKLSWSFSSMNPTYLRRFHERHTTSIEFSGCSSRLRSSFLHMYRSWTQGRKVPVHLVQVFFPSLETFD